MSWTLLTAPAIRSRRWFRSEVDPGQRVAAIAIGAMAIGITASQVVGGRFALTDYTFRSPWKTNDPNYELKSSGLNNYRTRASTDLY